MYEIAFSVSGCLRAGTRVDVAWPVETRGLGPAEPNAALAITPGGGRIGALLSGALDDQLAELVTAGASGRLAQIEVGDLEALAAGLPTGGTARCLLTPAGDLPPDLWDRLRDRAPVCLVTDLSGDLVVRTSLFTPETIEDAPTDASALFARAVSAAAITGDTVITALWPVPTLVVVGTGPVPDALSAAAALLGWQTRILGDPGAATGVIATLAGLDKVVVAAHDDEVAGPALEAALASDVGYIGALGGARKQRDRAEWLAYRDITDLRRIHGPAGLDIGAQTPAEIAVSILAEALSVSATGEQTGSAGLLLAGKAIT